MSEIESRKVRNVSEVLNEVREIDKAVLHALSQNDIKLSDILKTVRNIVLFLEDQSAEEVSPQDPEEDAN